MAAIICRTADRGDVFVDVLSPSTVLAHGSNCELTAREGRGAAAVLWRLLEIKKEEQGETAITQRENVMKDSGVCVCVCCLDAHCMLCAALRLCLTSVVQLANKEVSC